MKFFHAYDDHFIKGLEKNGLLNKDSGLRIQQSYRFPNHIKFNEYAKKGSKFYNYIKETKTPMYVDRLCGGATWHDYKFDLELANDYREMLGDWFLGFQVHESGSNRRRSEWKGIIRRMGHKGPYDLEEMKKIMVHRFAKLPDGTPLHSITTDSLEYYATKTYAETYPEFIEELKEMFQRRLDDTDDNVIPCDSYYLATKIQNDLGMRTFMPEVGAQIPLMRLAVAVARGMATCYNKTWGIYYECWREIPGDYIMPNYCLKGINERCLPKAEYISKYGENGGSSRLLQDRIYNHGYMSGCDYMSEEWGAYCSYQDCEEFTLSAYGKLKKEFIDRTQALGYIKANIPFAIVLPQELSCIELPDIFTEWKIGEHKTTNLESPLSQEEIDFFGHVEDVLKLIFANADEVRGNEGFVLTNSRFGDLFDVIYDDTPDEALKNYKYLIDATKEGNFLKKKGAEFNVIDSSDINKLEKTLKDLEKEIMPCYVEGLPYIVSKNEKGDDFLTIFNNEGNERDENVGDIIHHEADKTVRVVFKQTPNLETIYQSSKLEIKKIDDKTYDIFVPAASVSIIKF